MTRACAGVLLCSVLGCKPSPSASCTLETKPGALAEDGGAVVRGLDVIVDTDTSEFGMTEVDTHRVTLGSFVATYPVSMYKGQSTQSVLSVTLSDPSCGNTIRVEAPPGCQLALRPISADEYDLFCSASLGPDYPIARVFRRAH